MKKYLLIIACSMSVIAKAQVPAEIRLWPQNRLIDTANGHKLVEHDLSKPGEELVAGKDVIRLAEVTNPTIKIFTPKNPNGTAVIVCPGGGYYILALDLEGTELCNWYNSIGVTAILLKYRVPAPPGKLRYELPLQDAQRAVGLVRSNAAKWGIKPDHIGIMGFSAGGHLSALVSNSYAKRTYEQVDEADNESCRPDFTILVYPAYLVNDKEDGKLAPEIQVSANTPPTFIMQTEDDPINVENALYYYLALKKAGVSAEMHLYPSGGHGYGIRNKTGGTAVYPQLIEKWLAGNKF
ncbi:alpha/beta hydrolase [Mucilaginibacter gotjawali]|uniref:Acetylxylan esterase n=2 Tax=Mucilaginibacter gotjawali TaxID=1550579 RepID=A0A110B400_9SPHI|nr:alpha/beta hydrolase [Mucilaginibacter gotjawali]MBB3058543.1 acetyl esterase/lipase [Mucilaginibacter gotjawali]BAU55767.1 Acetylxylan esterase precursor [Mucilaginibacter gotjawali]